MSTTDYPAQHFAFADYFRKLFYETKDIFPDFANAVGGGQNIYNFSYYGLFRPDVLISYLLPWVPTYLVLTLYAIFLYLFGGCLLYRWISNHKFPKGICLLMGFMFLSSSVLFQSHRQIMFVNYMPFLIISLLGVDKYLKDKKAGMLVIGIFLMIMHSYYFSVSGILICCIYYLYRYYHKYKKSGDHIFTYFYGNNAVYKMFLWIFTAIMLSAAFLLPTALSMVENMRSGSESSKSFQILDFNFFCDTIIHDYYGCGFSFFIWFTLCIGLTMKKTRHMSACCILSLLLPVVPYLLNGTLYTHRKVYLTFIPVILYLCAKILHLKYQKTKADEMHYILVVIVPFVPLLCGSNKIWLIFDAVITIFILYVSMRNKKAIYAMVIVSSIVCLILNYNETFLSYDEYEQYYSQESLPNADDNDNYRFASLQGGIYKSNYVTRPDLLQTNVYSSIQNKYFESFMEDTMHLSTTSRNNMVHTNASNIFFQIFTGTRLLHSKKVIPAGYVSTPAENFYENKDILPIAYGTTNLLSYEEFSSLEYPYTLDTLINTSVVANPSTSNKYKSKIKQQSLEDFVLLPLSTAGVSFNMKEEKLSIDSTTKTKFSLSLNNDADIVIFSAMLDSNESVKDISITINGIKEKLSGTSAPYNNENTNFEYVISSNESVKELTFICSPGAYSLKNIRIFTCRYEDISQYHNKITPLETEQCTGKEILNGTLSLKQDGYFISSLPYQNGLSATIDGVPVEIENVNCGFAGFPMSEGTHNVILYFHAPGKKIGIIISILGLLICIFTYFVTVQSSYHSL